MQAFYEKAVVNSSLKINEYNVIERLKIYVQKNTKVQLKNCSIILLDFSAIDAFLC